MKNNKQTIIIPFTLPWNWSADYQRQTALELTRKGFNVIVYMNNDAHFFLKKCEKKYPKLNSIKFHIPKYFLPFRRYPIIEKTNKILSKILFSVSLLFKSKIIWVFDPQFFNFSKFFINKKSIYDCVDYHGFKQKINENKLIVNSTYFFVNSRSLYNLHKKIRVPNKIVPQGFNRYDFERYSKKIRNKKKNKKKTIGFIGGINNRINYKMLYPLIKDNPNWHFSFWGPLQKLGNDSTTWYFVKKIKKLTNTSFNKTINKLKLINEINKFDVGIIPYDISLKENLNCYPMKIFEYFYLGKPVISTPIKELKNKKFDSLIFIANTKKEFETKIKNILTNKWSKEKQMLQKELSNNNSWDNKISAILRIVVK